MSELFILCVFMLMISACYYAGQAYLWLRRFVWLYRRQRRQLVNRRALPLPRRKSRPPHPPVHGFLRNFRSFK